MVCWSYDWRGALANRIARRKRRFLLFTYHCREQAIYMQWWRFVLCLWVISKWNSGTYKHRIWWQFCCDTRSGSGQNFDTGYKVSLLHWQIVSRLFDEFSDLHKSTRLVNKKPEYPNLCKDKERTQNFTDIYSSCSKIMEFLAIYFYSNHNQVLLPKILGMRNYKSAWNQAILKLKLIHKYR